MLGQFNETQFVCNFALYTQALKNNLQNTNFATTEIWGQQQWEMGN
jgi:hypothetical protein